MIQCLRRRSREDLGTGKLLNSALEMVFYEEWLWSDVLYSDQEFDHEFVNELGLYIVSIVKSVGMCDLATIAEKVRISGISKVRRLFYHVCKECLGWFNAVVIVYL